MHSLAFWRVYMVWICVKLKKPFHIKRPHALPVLTAMSSALACREIIPLLSFIPLPHHLLGMCLLAGNTSSSVRDSTLFDCMHPAMFLSFFVYNKTIIAFFCGTSRMFSPRIVFPRELTLGENYPSHGDNFGCSTQKKAINL